MKEVSIIVFVGLAFCSCQSSKSTADCAPKREKHVNKMQMIPMPSDTMKPANRPKYD